MLQASSDHQSPESLSQLRVQICSVRLSSSTKLVDICVILEVDGKYTYRTDIIRKPNKSETSTSSAIKINETLDTLVTAESKINLKVHAPTRLFGANDLGHVELTLPSIIDEYHLKQRNNPTNELSPSYRVQLPFRNSSTSSSLFRSNENSNNPATGLIEVVFHGSILKQGRLQEDETVQTTPTESVMPILARKIIISFLVCRIHRQSQKIPPMEQITIPN